MPYFRYRARRGGELAEGTMEATSPAMVADQLLAAGLVPVHIEPLAASAGASGRLDGWRARLARRSHVRLDDLILLARQMYTLTKAGVPILRALRGLAETSRSPALAEALRAVIDDLQSGRDLATSLGRHPQTFPPLFCGMVQVGENTGRLEEAFLQIAEYLAHEKETRDRVKAALRYPTIVVAAISAAMVILSLFVIPTFEKVFKGVKMELPLPTRIILGISHFAQAWWPALLVAFILAGFAWRRFLKTETGRAWWDRRKLRLPVIGSILLRATLARFARAFAMAFHAGIPLVHALGITGRAVDNAFVTICLDKMRDGIERGDTLSNCAGNTRLFTPLVLQMLTVGEETGQVDSVLREVADFYSREVDYDLKNLTSLLEPILIVGIAGMVLVLALGVFLPMWNMTSLARGG